MEEEKYIHNCHVHIFGHQYVPEHILPFPMNLAASIIPKQWLARGIYRSRNPNPRKERYAHYILLGNHSQEQIFGYLKDFYYPLGTRFNVLTIDFTYMEAGELKAKHNFDAQVAELITLQQKHSDLIYPSSVSTPGAQTCSPL